MDWPLETRKRLAKLVKDTSLRILFDTQNDCTIPNRTHLDVLEWTNEKVLEFLEPLGFIRTKKDWRIEEYGGRVTLFRQSETHLWFETAQGGVVKITKEDAQKVLVLGFLE